MLLTLYRLHLFILHVMTAMARRMSFGLSSNIFDHHIFVHSAKCDGYTLQK